MERAVAGVHLQAVLFHILIVAVQQEVHLLSCMSQFRSVIPADGPSTYNSVSHISFTIPKKLLQKYEKKAETN